jgi:hypothetical protein
MKPIAALLRTMLKTLREPRNYPDKKNVQFQSERAPWCGLDSTTKPLKVSKRFQCLSEAVDFIAVCLETDAAENLASQIENLKGLLDADSGYAHYFAKSVFARLKEIHQEKDLRSLYREREFPAAEQGFKLGGHLSELGNIHIGFGQRDSSWVICDVWLTRPAPYGRLAALAVDRSRRHRHRRDGLGSHVVGSTGAKAEFVRQLNRGSSGIGAVLPGTGNETDQRPRAPSVVIPQPAIPHSETQDDTMPQVQAVPHPGGTACTSCQRKIDRGPESQSPHAVGDTGHAWGRRPGGRDRWALAPRVGREV